MFPVCFNDVLSDEIYFHFLLLVYFTSAFWSGGLTREEIKDCHQVVVEFLHELPRLHGAEECTVNSHLTTHLITMIENVGPGKSNNLFIFEHLNSEFKQSLHSPFATLRQTINQYTKKTHFDLIKVRDSAPRLVNQQVTSKFSFVDPSSNRICFNNLYHKNTLFSTSEHHTRTSDHFVELIDGKFYKIITYYRDHDTFKCEGMEIVKESDFEFESSTMQLSLDYIFNVKTTDVLRTFDFSEIAQKVIYSPHFLPQSATEDPGKGYILLYKHVHHN